MATHIHRDVLDILITKSYVFLIWITSPTSKILDYISWISTGCQWRCTSNTKAVVTNMSLDYLLVMHYWSVYWRVVLTGTHRFGIGRMALALINVVRCIQRQLFWGREGYCFSQLWWLLYDGKDRFLQFLCWVLFPILIVPHLTLRGLPRWSAFRMVPQIHWLVTKHSKP